MSRFTMHLERNLNPGLSKLYIVSGVLMIMVAILAARLLPGGGGPYCGRRTLHRGRLFSALNVMSGVRY